MVPSARSAATWVSGQCSQKGPRTRQSRRTLSLSRTNAPFLDPISTRTFIGASRCCAPEDDHAAALVKIEQIGGIQRATACRRTPCRRDVLKTPSTRERLKGLDDRAERGCRADPRQGHVGGSALNL